jgi:hypothetical protein
MDKRPLSEHASAQNSSPPRLNRRGGISPPGYVKGFCQLFGETDIPPPSRLKCVFPENSLPHPQSEHSTGLNTNGSCGGTFIRTSDFGCERVWIMNFRAISCLSWQKNRATKNTKIHKKILSRQYLPPVPGTRTDHSPKSPPHTARRPLCRFICQFRVRDAEWRYHACKLSQPSKKTDTTTTSVAMRYYLDA